MSDDGTLKVMVLGLRGFPNVQGGVESHCQELYPRIVERGIRVDVICRAPYVDKSLHEWKGVFFHSLWSPSATGLEAMLHSCVGVLYAAIKRPDVLHIHAIGPAIVAPLARLLGVKVVVTHHGPDYDREKWGAFARFILKTGEKLGVNFSNRRIVISEVIRSLVQDKYGKSSDRIPNGVSEPIGSSSTDALTEYNLVSGNYVLLVSRMVPEKRHLDLIRAFRKASLDGWKLVLVGDISAEDEYVRAVSTEVQIDSDVVLTGFRTGDELAGLLTYAGVFVLPSSHEGLPIALLEAMSFGLPVIASDIPAHLELELDQRCYFQLGNVDGLSDRLTSLVNDPQFREAQSDFGRQTVRDKYNWDNVADQTALLYREVAGTLTNTDRVNPPPV